MRPLTHSSVRSTRLSNNRSRRFVSLRQILPSLHTNQLLALTFCLVAGLALVSNFGSVTNSLRDWLRSSRTVSLDQKLAAQFPTLKASLTAQSKGFDRTTRMVDGRELAGLTVRDADAKNAGNATGIPAALNPVEQEALRLMAEREGGGAGEFKAFFPEQYTDSFVVEGGGVSASVRPLGARASVAEIENGKVVYHGVYPETDSLHNPGAARSEEFLYLKSADAPRRFEYELSEIKGATAVTMEGGAVTFKNEAGRGLQIEAPWVVDASGQKNAKVVRWELGAVRADGKQVLSLVVADGAELSYPLVIDPSWSTTGSLATARRQHTATLLPNGKVLVVGGYDGSSSFASAELYDPAAGTWSPTDSLTTGRYNHTATLLPNGKVLVVGGYNIGTSYLASAELYDPAAGTWSATGSLTTARYAHTATLLPNGKVLVVGGDNLSSNYLASAELYDPAAGTWSVTGSLTTARFIHTATLLPNGKVLVVGGYNGSYLASAELYDPAAGTWSVTGSLTTARYFHTATLLPNGKVLVVGGSKPTYLASAELYDPAVGTWSATDSLATARTGHTATLLPNGKVLVVGGYNSSYPASAELYDPAAGTWSVTGSLTTARYQHTATLLPNGKVLVVGGYNGSYLASAELYDLAAGTWSVTNSLTNARYFHTATLLPNGKVLVVGGYNGSYLTSAEFYDPAVGLWSATVSLTNARYQHTATLLPNGKVLVVGGYNGSYLASAELYDLAAGTWSATGSLTNARQSHTATLLPNGKVLVVGGSNGSALASAELYDPATGTWSAAGSLTNARYFHTATLLPNGKVLVVGGYNGSYLTSAELYDPAAGTWSVTGSLTTARSLPTATLLPNGKVLVVGGYNGSYLTSAELYDPVAGTWSATGPLTTGRNGHTATLLPNGKVLVVGGYNGSYLTSAELYDSAAGTWSATGSLTDARQVHTATLLPNGKVLVVGGYRGSYIASAELYDVGLGFTASSQPVIATATSPLQLTTKLTLSGTRFQGVSGSSSDNMQSSATNYPVVQLRSLVNEQTIFLPSDPTANWSDTSFTSQAVTNFPRGHALVRVYTNGIPSDAKLIQVTGPVPAFSNLSGPTITYGQTPTTLSGTISYGANFPTGNVSITLNGVTQQAAIQAADGTFSSSFATGTLGVSGSPYTITYSYAGDGTYDGITDSSKTLTVNKATATVTLSNLSQTYDGNPKSATATTTPAGLTVDITYSQGGTPVASPTDAGSYDVTATINDPNYQGSATGTLVITDTTAPTVTINHAFGEADPTSSSPINFTVVFSEAVNNFTTGDVTITSTTGANTATVTGSGTTYNVAVSGMTANGIVTATIAAGVATDASGNPNEPATFTDNTVTYNGAPTTSLVVTTAADTFDGSDASLRDVIMVANSRAGTDAITFNIPGAGPHIIQLESALPALTESVDILNTSGKSITIKGEGSADPYRIFTINAGQTVNISYLTISNGYVNNDGGGIYVYGTLNLTNSTVSGNVANGSSGGGILVNGGTVNLTNSTVSGNSAGQGGGIDNFGTLNVTNSTISNNFGQLNGGGIHRGSGAATLRNTIVAKNTSDGSCKDFSGGFNSEGYNLIGDLTCATITEAANAGTNITSVDPNLGPLANNGGPTQTHSLLSGSPALDMGKNFSTLSIDQRGRLRPFDDSAISNATGGDGSDIGAFEFIPNAAPTITAAGALTRQQGSGASNSQIGTVGDADQAANTLTVTATPLTGAGVTVNNINIDASGNVTADVAADCTATGSTFTLTVTDSESATATAILTVNVPANTAPTLTYATPQSVAFNGSVTVTPTAAADNGSITGYAVQSVVPAMTTAPTVNASGVVSITNAQPAGAHTITIRATDNCSLTKDAAFSLDVQPQPPALGNYPDTTVNLAADTTITPDAAPTNVTGINVSTDTNFKGNFAADPVTGVVRVTNAHPAGIYAVTVRASNSSVTTKTFMLAVQTGTACAGAPVFTNAADVSIGTEPFSIAVGDFNNDGKQDFAAANYSSNNVSIRIGDGAGNFTGTTDVSVGTNPRSVAIGDFNNDGKQDFATANQHSNNVSIRIGDGAGNFTVNTNVSVGSFPNAIAIGDFNNDGKQDLATADSANNVSIRLGDGAGNFTGTTGVSVGSGPISVAIGDFNNDGKQDLATANSHSNNVSIRMGDGAGNFTGTTDVSVGASPTSVAIGDFNNDGKQDFAAANFDSGTVSIRLGDGAGNFTGTTNVSVGIAPFSVDIGDFNNDGKQDIAAANAGPNNVSILIGDGAGNFTVNTNVNVGSFPTLIAIGDFNSDGKQDLAAANRNSNNVSIRLGGCNPSPAITAATGLSRQQGSPASNSQIATVTDDGGNASVTVTVTSANPSNGVTISNIVNTGGNITANIAASCAASNATFTLQASDGASTVTASLNVNATANSAPTLTYATPQAATFAGSLNVTPTAASDNGPVTYQVLTGHGLTTTPTVNASGVVSITNAQPAGAHTITIRATDNCGFITDAGFTLNVSKSNPTITFGALADKTFGNPDFNVSATASSNLTVSFTAGGNCTVTGNSVHLTGAGSCTITAKQGGDNNFNAAPDVARTFTVAKAATSTALTSSVNPSAFGQTVTFTATVTSGAGTPTGLVQFKDNGNNLGGLVALNASGQAQVSTSTLTAGTHTITADYNGDGNFLTSTGTLAGGQEVKLQVSLSINDVSVTEGQAGTKVMNFTVSLSAASNLTVTADFATANGTATAGSDYVATNGTVTFNPGDLTKTIPVTINGDIGFESNETFTVTLSNATNATISDNQGTGTIQNDDAQGGLIGFSNVSYSVNEDTGNVTVTVTRTNDVSQAATVDYATDDTGSSTDCAALSTGLASQRCDYTLMLGTLNFAANETQKTINIPINLDGYTEGPETFTVRLTNPTGGAALIAASTATVTINDSTSPTGNPLDDTASFVRQQYHDFLNRDADPAGLAFWTDNIEKCKDPNRLPQGQTVLQCIEIQRLNTSAAFFLSIEFQQTGNFVRSFYVAALDRPATNNMEAFIEFERDTQEVQQGVIVNQGNWQQTLNNNRDAFMREFVMRAEFVGLYPTTDTPTQYVDKLCLHAKVTPTPQERLDAIAEFGGSSTAADAGARGRALLRVTKNSAFESRELNRSFVQMEYFGYLRRNPNDPPDTDFSGYNFWLNKLNQSNGNFIDAEMVKAFVASSEYRRRFGP